MQIVIDIDDEQVFFDIKNRGLTAETETDKVILNALYNGKPLPKGHGRLGDLGKVYDKLNEAQIEGTEEYKGLGEAKQIICEAPTIIEADKESD